MEGNRSHQIRLASLSVLVIAAMLCTVDRAHGQGPKPWRVWQKDYPCSGRTDWVSVATENPGDRGGLAYFEVFPGSHSWATQAEALAEAATLRFSPRFPQYCCHNWDVYINDNTKAFSVVDNSLPPRVPLGYRIFKPNLCCEDAWAYAGFQNPGTCGASHKAYGCGGIGEKWNEHEGDNWNSVWVRRGNTDMFDVTYTGPAGQQATTVNSVTASGDLVSARRVSSSDNNLCTYSGVIASNGLTIQGTYTCPRGGTRPWKADIICAGSPPKPPQPPGVVDMTGMWVWYGGDPQVTKWRFELVLRPAGTGVWEGSITLITNRTDSNVQDWRKANTGSVRIVDAGGGEGVDGKWVKRWLRFSIWPTDGQPMLDKKAHVGDSSPVDSKYGREMLTIDDVGWPHIDHFQR